MSWIKSHQELARHPKTRKLARLLSISLPDALGRLHLLWWWALDYAEDGDLSKHDSADIADALLWEGEPDALIDALITSGFLDSDRKIHDWWEYAGSLVEKRRANATRMRARRAAYVQDTTIARTGAREEKRRVEKSREEKTLSETPEKTPIIVPESALESAPKQQSDKKPDDKKPEQPLTEIQLYYASNFPGKNGPKRLNTAQKKLIDGLERDVGPEIFRKAVDWAAVIPQPSLNAIRTTALKMKREGNGNGKSKYRPAYGRNQIPSQPIRFTTIEEARQWASEHGGNLPINCGFGYRENEGLVRL